MTDLELALDDCLACLADGTASVDECLARYPEQAAALQPLLTTARLLGAGHAAGPSADFKAATLRRLQSHMRAHPRHVAAQRSGMLTRRAAVGVGLATALFVLTSGTAVAQAAVPGQPLYGWKRASEQVWRSVSPDPLGTDLALTARRAAELQQLAGEAGETQARSEYQQSLAALEAYTDPAAQDRIYTALTAQQDDLNQVGVVVPELDQKLAAPPNPTNVPEIPIGVTVPSSTPQPPAGEGTAPAPAHTQLPPPALTHMPPPEATKLPPQALTHLPPAALTHQASVASVTPTPGVILTN